MGSKQAFMDRGLKFVDIFFQGVGSFQISLLFFIMFLWYYSSVYSFRNCWSVSSILVVFILFCYGLLCPLSPLAFYVCSFFTSWIVRKAHIIFGDFDLMSMIWSFLFVVCIDSLSFEWYKKRTFQTLRNIESPIGQHNNKQSLPQDNTTTNILQYKLYEI